MLPYLLTVLTIIVGLPGATLSLLLLIDRRKKKRNDQTNHRTFSLSNFVPTDHEAD